MNEKDRLHMIRKIRLSKDIEIVPSKNNFAEYPWEECIADQIDRYGDEETAKKVCGAIKAGMKRSFQEGDSLENSCWPGYIAIGLKPSADGSRMVPNCVPEKEGMSKVKEGFPVPSPSSDEDEQTYVSRCIKELYDEYGQEQSAAICYSKWREK